MPATLDTTTGTVAPTARPQPPRFAVATQRLDELTRLAANWDGHGAPTIKSTIIASAKSFLGRVGGDARVQSMREEATFPAVVPLSSGAVQLEFHVGDRILELEFETPDVIRFLKWWPQKGIAVEESYNVTDLPRSLALISWVWYGRDTE